MTGSRLYQESDHDSADAMLPEVMTRFNWLMRLEHESDPRRLLHKLYRATLDVWGINPNGSTHEIARDARCIAMKEFKCQRIRDFVGQEQINALSVWLAGELRP